jgi:hypothetical protein
MANRPLPWLVTHALVKLDKVIEMNVVVKIKHAPNVGLEPTTLRLRVSCSTD